MKRQVILGLSLLVAGIASMAPARVQAASMAVLVVGLETDAASDMFAAGIRYEFGQKGYTMVNDTGVQTKLTALRQAYKDGQPVDTVGLAAWGREHSIDFVQLVVEKSCDITIGGVPKSGREQLTQVVSCGIAKYTDRATYRTRFVRYLDPNPNLGTGFEEMVYVAGGVFEMGYKSDRDEVIVDGSELPCHYVRVNSFYIGKYSVTQGLWKAVMGSLPSSLGSSYQGDNKPVVYVNYDDIVGTDGFLAKLNAITGKNYRLPTEAEWEYAARGCSAGNCESYIYSGSDTIDDVAWYPSNCSTLQVVGQKRANGLGLYDMSGNVYDWCSDWYGDVYYPSGTTASSPQYNPTGPTSGSYRVLRGGRWNYIASRCRVAFRGNLTPSTRGNGFGFRLV